MLIVRKEYFAFWTHKHLSVTSISIAQNLLPPVVLVPVMGPDIQSPTPWLTYTHAFRASHHPVGPTITNSRVGTHGCATIGSTKPMTTGVSSVSNQATMITKGGNFSYRRTTKTFISSSSSQNPRFKGFDKSSSKQTLTKWALNMNLVHLSTLRSFLISLVMTPDIYHPKNPLVNYAIASKLPP